MFKLKKFMSYVLVLILVFALLSVTAIARNNFINVEIPQEVYEENHHAVLALRFTIEIENVEHGIIRAVYPDGYYVELGTVRRPATTVGFSAAGFWAAYYTKAQDGTFSNVIASATNNFHMKFGPQETYNPLDFQDWSNVPAGMPRPWIPRQVTVAPFSEWQRILAWATPQNNIIYTDIHGGDSIFGGRYSPYIGSPIEYLTPDGTWESLDNLYYDGNFDRGVPENLRIRVYQASTSRGLPVYFEFENWAAGDTVAGIRKDSNGRVLMHTQDGATRHIADLIQRVQGTGRFGGSEYAHHASVRASHPGVLCLSTAPQVGRTYDAELRAGFQFVPANHAKFLNYNLNQNSFIDRDQWGVIAHVGATSDALFDSRYVIDGEISYNPIWEGVAPLFSGFLNSRYVPGNRELSTFYMVSTDFGATWHDPPEIWATTGLNSAGNIPSPVADWTNIRVFVNYSLYSGSSVELTAANPTRLRLYLETYDRVYVNVPGNLGIFAHHSPFTVPEGKTLVVANVLNIHGSINIEGRLVVLEGGRVNNMGQGIITIAEGGALINNGHIENQTGSSVINYGMILNSDRFEIRAGTTLQNRGVIGGAVSLRTHRDAIVVD